VMFDQTQKDFIRNLLDENPIIEKQEIIKLLLKSKLATGKTPKQSYNRALVQVLKERNIPISRENKTKPTTIIQTQNGVSKISDEEFARDDFIDREIEPEVQWRRKLLKTGKTSNPKWKTSTNIEVYTFINSDDDKFNFNLYQELFEAVQSEIPFMTEIDDDGYSDNLVDRYEIETEYEYPTANLIINGKKTEVILK
jgi:hypothetical protein